MKKLLLLLLPLTVVLLLAFRNNDAVVISGTVLDAQANNPLAGINVTALSNAGTQTDAAGKFSITVTETTAILTFSGSGYATQTISVNNASTHPVIRMMPVSHALQEAVANSKRVSKSYHQSRLYANAAPSGILGGGYYDRRENYNTEEYSNMVENGFKTAKDDPLSTFSIDVDGAAYSNVRRFLNNSQLPPPGAVRTEEMLNYFKYNYPQPKGNDPFSINTEISVCPWNTDHKLVLIGLQGKNIPTDKLPASNLVFLIDVSGSMSGENRLGLVKSSMKLLINNLREQDKVSMVVYAGAAGLVLPPTSGADKTKLRDAVDRLEAGGSTAGGAGIKLAYKTALENYMPEGNNRIILCTDGDFNVGASSEDDLVRMVEAERNKGVFLTVLGYGMGNYKDNKMQQLADKGNGNHSYIDNIHEANKVLVSEFGGTLFTIAKDVKLQLEFNPQKVAGYRLIGYENRMLNKEDFNDDKKDAGELGSGHTVTALYEIIPAGVPSKFLKSVDPLKYTRGDKDRVRPVSNELLTVKFRYKDPKGDVSKLLVHPLNDAPVDFAGTSNNFRFASAVAGFGMMLRNSEFKGISNFSSIRAQASSALEDDKEGYRFEFVKLVDAARLLTENKASAQSMQVYEK